ncbi:glycosyltransferase family 25 protein [Annulohypoxylon truncatum]|uniref:glycosyltransferase family 25 protein n=1 Tax=Annulohypoxylon truncatum TaxID=327061 RepID=UPI002007B846|nr:glycosyltransferase family 25 protein [Annulohypoxylon truncatum]KAI1204920.1 glycosyltransferase family 25 protein [Annulohypoxylon truncatum]
MLRPNWAGYGTVQRTRCAVIALVVVILVVGLWQSRDNVYAQLQKHKSIVSQSKSSPREIAANSTLGFQKILALSSKPSWRTRGLEAAGHITGLEFTIPPQGQNSDDLIRAFQNIGADRGAKRPEYGSARAWLSHLDLLKYVIASDLETALIIEDDVDWDVRIKSEMRLVSDNVRAYTRVREDDPTPFGKNWDVLWLGHCGSIITDDMAEPRVYADDSRCETDLYSGWSKRFLREKLTEGHRQVQTSMLTVCTFGFGVTKHGARKMLPLLSKGGDEAYDVALSGYCRDQKLKCLVVNPQLFNHYEPPPDSGYLSDVHVGDGKGQTSDDVDFEDSMGTTGNIMKSARCEALFHETCMRPPSDL